MLLARGWSVWKTAGFWQVEEPWIMDEEAEDLKGRRRRGVRLGRK